MPSIINDSVVVTWKNEKYEYSYMLPTSDLRKEGPYLEDREFPQYLHKVRVFELDADGERGNFVGVVPNFEAVNRATDDKLPQFIYRISHAKSGGESVRGHFRSASLVDGLGATSFSTVHYEEVQRALYLHLQGCRSPDGIPFYSPFISFTDSWMFALWWASYHKNEGVKDIKIHIVDTYILASPTLVLHSYTAAKAYQIGPPNIAMHAYKKMIGGTYTEYLVWNELRAVSADVVDFESILKAKEGTHLRTINLFESHRCLNDDLEEQVILNKPAALRKMIYDDIDELDWQRNKAYQGPCSMKWLRPKLSATRTRQPRLPKYITPESQRFDLDLLTFESFKSIAMCFNSLFRMDVLLAHLAIWSGSIHLDTIAETLSQDAEAKRMAIDVTYFPTCLKSFKKKEVEAQQRLWLETAVALDIPVVCGSQRPRRNLIRLENSRILRQPAMFSGLGQTRSHLTLLNGNIDEDDDDAQDTATLDALLKDLDHNRQQSRKLLKSKLEPRPVSQVAADADIIASSSSRSESTSYAPFKRLAATNNNGSVSSRSDTIWAKGRARKKQRRLPKGKAAIFHADIDIVEVDGERHLGIKHYLQSNPQTFEEMDRLSRTTQAGFTASEGVLSHSEAGIEARHKSKENDGEGKHETMLFDIHDIQTQCPERTVYDKSVEVIELPDWTSADVLDGRSRLASLQAGIATIQEQESNALVLRENKAHCCYGTERQ